MGVGFITYAAMTPEFQVMSRPERAAAMERLKGQAAEHDVHMLMWGHPYGVNENLIIVYESGKGVENYNNMVLDDQNVYVDSRTTVAVLEY
ncbi:hypothetical protein H8D40_03580 [Candidatus Bathyarchaeota archaeon]|nr:hypothetical protein [Candidatus Bathyarchaeota archaeon]